MQSKEKFMNTSLRRAVLIASATVAALGLAIYLALGDGGREGPGRRAGDEAGSSADAEYREGGASAQTVAELLEYRLASGKAYEYRFRRGMQAELGGEQMVDLKLSGTVTPHVVRARNGLLDLIVQVAILKAQGIETKDLPGFQGGAARYLVHLQIDRLGNPQFLRFPAALSDPGEQGLVRDVLSAWLQPLPALGAPVRRPSENGWWRSIFGGDTPMEFTVTGTDTQGIFEAALRLNPAEEIESKIDFQLEKEAYKNSLTPIRIEASEHRIAWKIDQGTYGESAGQDKFQSGPSDFQVAATLDYAYELDGVSPAQFTVEDLTRFSLDGEIYDVRAYLSDREVDVPERTKPATWSEIKPRLAAVTAEMAGPERTEIFNTLAVSMKADPSLAREAARTARELPGDDHRFQMVMGALSYSGSPAAQNELVSLFSAGDLDRIGRESVIDAFTMMTEAPTAEGLQLLKDAFASDDADLSGRAGLALGSAQRNNPTEELRQWIIQRWRAAQNNVQRQTVLEYVGNSGDPQLLSIVDEALQIDDFDLRRLALDATRFMDAGEVNSYLLRFFEDARKNERLRYEALNSLAQHRWEERFLPVMENCVRSETMEAIRMRCARYTLEQLRHERRMQELLRGLRPTAEPASWAEFIDLETNRG